jgi:thioredoxin reductase (NADPH)
VEGADPLICRSVIIAAGIEYRRLDVPGIDRYEGVSVFYSPLDAEHRVGSRDAVIVVGGGNSAGQAATALAAAGHQVTLVIRGPALAANMVRYLVDRVQHEPRIDLLTDSEVVGVTGETSLQGVLIGKHGAGSPRHIAATAMFILIGAAPYTAWLHDTVRLDDAGYVLTGSALGPTNKSSSHGKASDAAHFP